jgi:hypothetical protein
MNDLLFFMSGRGSGTWQRFRTAVEELQLSNGMQENVGTLPMHQQLRMNLERLAHVEFFTSGGEWRVTPPTLALSGTGAVLCGGRTPQSVDQLQRLAPVMTTAQTEAPDAITLQGTTEDFRAIAATLQLQVQPDAPQSLLRRLPAVDDPRTWVTTTLPGAVEQEIARFMLPSFQWKPSTVAEAISDAGGLFRLQGIQASQYFFCVRGEVFASDAQTGKYLVACSAGRNVLKYDTSNQFLSMLATMRPPLLVERALVLCSGQLPAYDSGTKELRYSNIPPDVIELVRLILGQIA